MKTLILNGSPNKHGHTQKMIDVLIDKLNGEIIIKNIYDLEIKACTDCGYCERYMGCPIVDDMIDIYELTENVDNLIVASPVHTSCFSAPLMALFSRYQVYFAGKYIRKDDNPGLNEKKGAVLITAGTNWEDQFEAIKQISKFAMLESHTNVLDTVYFAGTDKIKELSNDTYEKLINLSNILNGGE